MSTFLAALAREKLALTALVSAVVKLLILFEIVNLTEAQNIQLLLVLDLALMLLARLFVTPTSDPSLPVGTSVNSGSAVVASVDPPPPPTATTDPPVVELEDG